MFKRHLKQIERDQKFKIWLGEYFIALQKHNKKEHRLYKIYAAYRSGINPESFLKLGMENQRMEQDK